VLSLTLAYIQVKALAEQSAMQEDENVNFQWAFVVLKNSNSGSQFTAITHDTALKSGDKLKMLVRLNKKCFVYVFYHSSQGALYMLFPYTLSQFSNDYEVSKKYYIPQSDFVFELDENIGQEKYYLIASAQRLPELEDLYSSYESTEDVKKPKYFEKIIHEIRELRKSHKTFTTKAERPIISVGAIRAHLISEGSEYPDLDKFLIEFSANDFFAKTFTIDHK
jgi:hypothetical protein